jgi:hypothetical protein
MAPPLPNSNPWCGGGGGGRRGGYLRYFTRLNSVESSARKSSRHSMRDLRKFTDECSARKCPCFSKGVVFLFAAGRSARKRSYAVFWNVPAFPGEGSFDIFPTSIAVLIVPWIDRSRSFVKHLCTTRNATGRTTSGVHRFSKNLGEAELWYETRSSQRTYILGSCVQKSVATRIPGARGLCTPALR